MENRLYPVLENILAGFDASFLVGQTLAGKALAQVAEAHPALEPLLDFVCADPVQIAVEVGMVYAGEEDSIDDLQAIDLGPEEWFEPAVGLIVVQQALRAIQNNPQSISAAVYAPGLHAAAVIADLEALEQALLFAQNHETRFHFVLNAKP